MITPLKLPDGGVFLFTPLENPALSNGVYVTASTGVERVARRDLFKIILQKFFNTSPAPATF